MVMLLMAGFLWGGCLACVPITRASHCCDPSGECKRAPSPSKNCAAQPVVLGQTVVSPDHEAILISSVAVASTCRPPTGLLVLAPSDVAFTGTRGSPPDLQLLNSVFRI